MATRSMEIIDADGDLVLHFEDGTQYFRRAYCVSRTLLRKRSDFMHVMLDPNKFSEGRSIEAQLQSTSLSSQGKSTSSPIPDIPSATIKDLPRVQLPHALLAPLLRLFLSILHDLHPRWPFQKRASVKPLAILARFAERFQAVRALKRYLREQHEAAKPAARVFDHVILDDEQSNRLKLIVGVILDEPAWVQQSSGFLITETSLGNENPDEDEDELDADGETAWDSLPEGIKKEILCRQRYILDAIHSIQTWFLQQYCSGATQCKKFYANSSVCDSFHLGEALRHFSHRGTLDINSAFGSQPVATPSKSLRAIIQSLRACPGYQVDQWHAHCGIRQRLLPILERLTLGNQVGICLTCWRSGGTADDWSRHPVKGGWAFDSGIPKTWQRCEDHSTIAAMFTADAHSWAGSDSTGLGVTVVSV